MAAESVEVEVLPRSAGPVAVSADGLRWRGAPGEAPQAVPVDDERGVEFVEQRRQVVVVRLHVKAAGLPKQVGVAASGEQCRQRARVVRVHRRRVDVAVGGGDAEPHGYHT